MKEVITKIFKQQLGEIVQSIHEIIGLGTVNNVYEIITSSQAYIIRLNHDLDKQLEYQKEQWCLEQALRLDILSPKVFAMGQQDSWVFMIQEKILGISGKSCSKSEKQTIWEVLGRYAKNYHRLPTIDIPEVVEREFHRNWKARIQYNIQQLNQEDSLLQFGFLTAEIQQKIRQLLESLMTKPFKSGLVHGDLCPRNVIMSKKQVYLLDWGTAEINIVPQHEIGLVLLSNEANSTEFNAFLKGLGISARAFHQMRADIYVLNLVHCLDKYRWAESFDIEELPIYQEKITKAFQQIEKSNS